MINVESLRLNGKTYNGNTDKFGVVYKGFDCIVKLPKEHISVYSEYIASNFIRSLNIPCQQVGMDTYGLSIVNVIVDFTFNTGLSLHSFKDIKQSSEDTDIEDKEHTYSDVLYLIDKHLKMSDVCKIEAKVRFWDMFICDAILGNRDRHWEIDLMEGRIELHQYMTMVLVCSLMWTLLLNSIRMGAAEGSF